MSSIIYSLFPPESVAFAVLALTLAGAVGLFIGQLKIFKINIGIAGVLFAGIILSYFGIKPNEKILEFVREFGLILFVYAVGTQVGPGFLSSFKKDGIKFNLMATGIIISGIFITIIIAKFFNIDSPSAIGMYCGAVTNTPSLAAAQQTMMNTPFAEKISDISVGYALAYPGAIAAIILSMILIRSLFSKESEGDIEGFAKPLSSSKIENYSIKVENKNLNGVKIKDIPAIDSFNIVVSRILKGEKVSVAHEEEILALGDIILAVGEKENLDKFMKIVGSLSEIDLRKLPGKIIHSRVIVSKKNMVGKTLSESGIFSHNVIATRAARADVEFMVNDDYALQYGDNLVLVGEESDVKKASAMLGNSPKDLNHPQLIPVFIGIIAGVVIGSIPFNIPGFSQPLKLGLAGGPLLAAIFFSNIQNIGTISWYMPPAGNLMIREIGIVLFLASVGLKSGENFFHMLIYGAGLKIAALAFLISFIPVFGAGLIMKIKYKSNYLSLCGALAGSMTDPPALAFANSISPSSAASVSYASVYPWVMFLRIVSAQLLVLFFPG